MQGPEGTGVSLQVVAIGDRFSQPWVGPGQEGHDRLKGADETRMLLDVCDDGTSVWHI
jgi:hypothetical protein